MDYRRSIEIESAALNSECYLSLWQRSRSSSRYTPLLTQAQPTLRESHFQQKPVKIPVSGPLYHASGASDNPISRLLQPFITKNHVFFTFPCVLFCSSYQLSRLMSLPPYKKSASHFCEAKKIFLDALPLLLLQTRSCLSQTTLQEPSQFADLLQRGQGTASVKSISCPQLPGSGPSVPTQA